MISAIFISMGLMAGWLIAVTMAATVTIAIGAAAPGFVVTDYHTIRFRFKVLETWSGWCVPRLEASPQRGSWEDFIRMRGQRCWLP